VVLFATLKQLAKSGLPASAEPLALLEQEGQPGKGSVEFLKVVGAQAVGNPHKV